MVRAEPAHRAVPGLKRAPIESVRQRQGRAAEAGRRGGMGPDGASGAADSGGQAEGDADLAHREGGMPSNRWHRAWRRLPCYSRSLLHQALSGSSIKWLRDVRRQATGRSPHVTPDRSTLGGRGYVKNGATSRISLLDSVLVLL